MKHACALALVAAAVLTMSACRKAEPPVDAGNAIEVEPVAVPNFSLIDQDNKPFEFSSLRGKVVLVFFGYTMCPDACPTTLSKLSAAYKKLSPEERARVKTVYISVDPERDTPAVMKDHLTYFGVDAIGLTGKADDISRVAKIFGVHYEKSTVPTAGGYTMAHTASVFSVDAKGRGHAIIQYDSTVDDVLKEVRAALGAA